jgi:hypothetical protein
LVISELGVVKTDAVGHGVLGFVAAQRRQVLADSAGLVIIVGILQDISISNSSSIIL